MRSGRWFLIRSYSRRPCFGGLGFLGLVVGGFLRAALVFFGPVPTFLGSGKVCWKVILLGESAGEPHMTVQESEDCPVYPRACGGTPPTFYAESISGGLSRACGGTAVRANIDLNEKGLSPRLRGNHRSRQHRPERKGSIPAPAGEPPFAPTST